ncbi:MAG: zinc-ribbon domain-containing protein [Bradymonadia bacterium]
MKCTNCGSSIPGAAKFCGVCGTPTQSSETDAALETVAFDPTSDPEFKAAAEKLEAESKKTQAEANTEAQTASEPEVNGKAAAEEPAQADSGDTSAVETPKEEKASDAPKPEAGGSGKKGKFRETIWFMQAEDPEMMSSIENEELGEREATYQDPGGSLDERSREKFSLNISESSMMKAVERESLEANESPENSKSWFYASIVIGVVSVGYIVYLTLIKS